MPLDRDDRARRAGRRRPPAAGPRPPPGHRARRRDRAATPTVRRPGRRSAGRGSGGRAGSSYSARQRAHIVNAGHRRERPVVGDAAHDREARAAVGAVDERVAVAAVAGIEQLAQAVARRSRCRARRARRRAPPRGLSRIAKPASPGGSRSSVTTRSTTASGGASRRQPGEEAARPTPAPPSTSIRTPRASLSTKPAEPVLDAPAGRRRGGSRRPARSPPPRTRARRRASAPAAAAAGRRRGDLDQLAQRVVGARLRLLDARDVLGAGDHDVVGERLGGDAAAVVADHRDRHQPSRRASASASMTLRRVARGRQREQRVAGARRRRSPGGRRSPRRRCRWRSRSGWPGRR